MIYMIIALATWRALSRTSLTLLPCTGAALWRCSVEKVGLDLVSLARSGRHRPGSDHVRLPPGHRLGEICTNRRLRCRDHDRVAVASKDVLAPIHLGVRRRPQRVLPHPQFRGLAQLAELSGNALRAHGLLRLRPFLRVLGNKHVSIRGGSLWTL